MNEFVYFDMFSSNLVDRIISLFTYFCVQCEWLLVLDPFEESQKREQQLTKELEDAS